MRKNENVVSDKSHQHEWEGIAIWQGSDVIAHVVPDHHDEHEDNARRIVALLNMTMHFTTEEIEQMAQVVAIERLHRAGIL